MTGSLNNFGSVLDGFFGQSNEISPYEIDNAGMMHTGGNIYGSPGSNQFTNPYPFSNSYRDRNNIPAGVYPVNGYQSAPSPQYVGDHFAVQPEFTYRNDYEGGNNLFAAGNEPHGSSLHNNGHANHSSSASPFSSPYLSQDIQYQGSYPTQPSTVTSEVHIKHEDNEEDYEDDFNPASVADDDEYIPNLGGDDDARHASYNGPVAVKKRKVNKDGKARKVREPRGHLRRWDENDLAKALIGVVWACGENGVQIPFEQAAKLIDQDCTASALQQAILKIQAKLNKENNAQLPKIKMNWPKKKEAANAKHIVRDNGKVPRKKPTLTQGTQCSLQILPLPRSLGQRVSKTAATGFDGAQDKLVPAPNKIVDIQVRNVHLLRQSAEAQTTNLPAQVAESSTQADVPSTADFDSAFATMPQQEHHSASLARAGSAGNGTGTDSSEMKREGATTPQQAQHSSTCPPAPARRLAGRPTVRQSLNEPFYDNSSSPRSLNHGRTAQSFSDYIDSLTPFEQFTRDFGTTGSTFVSPSRLNSAGTRTPSMKSVGVFLSDAELMDLRGPTKMLPGHAARKDSLFPPPNAQPAKSYEDRRGPQIMKKGKDSNETMNQTYPPMVTTSRTGLGATVAPRQHGQDARMSGLNMGSYEFNGDTVMNSIEHVGLGATATSSQESQGTQMSGDNMSFSDMMNHNFLATDLTSRAGLGANAIGHHNVTSDRDTTMSDGYMNPNFTNYGIGDHNELFHATVDNGADDVDPGLEATDMEWFNKDDYGEPIDRDLHPNY